MAVQSQSGRARCAGRSALAELHVRPYRPTPAGTSRTFVYGSNYSKSGRPDLNRGPPPPKGGALPGCATPRGAQCRRRDRFRRRGRGPTAPRPPLRPRQGRLARRRRRAALRRDRRRRSGPSCSRARPTTWSRSTCRNRTADGPQRAEATPTSTRRRRSRPGSRRARSSHDAEPAIWALTRTTPAPTASAHTRRGILARVRVEDYGAGPIRPHERTQPGPEGGPAAADPRHPPQPLADLLAQHRGRLAAGRAGASTRRALGRGHRRRRHRHRVWRIERPGGPRARSPQRSPAPSC